MCGEDVADNGNLPVTESGVTEGEGSPTVDMVWIQYDRRGEPQCGYGVGGYSVDTMLMVS